MAIQYINTGLIANDGTGDDLREAFTKINDNFEDLDSRVIETITVENAGTLGQPIYAGRAGSTDSFKRLVGGNNISLSATDNGITINAADAIQQLLFVSDSGSISVQNGSSLRIRGGESINTRTDGQDIIFDLDDTDIVARDSNPILSANLNANNKDITGAKTITAETFNGALTGTVNGFDISLISGLLGFNFGGITNVFNNSLELIVRTLPVDFGAIDPPDYSKSVDLGTF